MSNNQTQKEYKQQWRKLNADKINQQSKEYYQNNREEILEKRRQYRANNADNIKDIKANYRLNNADKIKESKHNYYYKHRDQILDKQKEYQTLKVNCCLCGGSVRKYYLVQHQSTNTCKKKYMLLNGNATATSITPQIMD